LARALVDPRVSLMGVVSGLSMALSGLANLGNVEEWKRAPLGNLLKSAADMATGITIILASIIGLAIAVLALAWAAAILTFGLLGGLAAVVTPFCTAVIATLTPWTLFAAKWALALNAISFIKNLIDAAVATSARDLQNQSDQMTEDAKHAGAMAATIAVIKVAQAGGRRLAATGFGRRVTGAVRSVGQWAKIYPPPAAGASAAAGGAVETAPVSETPPATGADGTVDTAPPAETTTGRPKATDTPSETSAAGERPVRGCFVAGTPVLTPDGPRAIESLQPGELVLAYDVDRGALVPQPIGATLTRTVPVVLDLAVAAETITCSPEHPFWTPEERRWRLAGSLEPGAALLAADGATVKVEAVRPRPAGDWQVHNITVSGLSTYFVSSMGIVVHNKSREGDPPELRAAKDAAGMDLRTLRGQVADLTERAQQLPEGQRQGVLKDIESISEQLEGLQDNVSGADSPETISGLDDWKADLARQLGELESSLPQRPAPAAESEAPAAETAEEPPPSDEPTNWEDVNPTDSKDWPPEWQQGPFKEAIPNTSGKEAATDIPGWAQGAQPRVGEDGEAFARRIMGYRFPGRPESTLPKGARSDWSKLKKSANRGYRDPE